MRQTPTPTGTAARPIPEWWPHVILGVASLLLVTLLVVSLYYASSTRRLLTELQEYTWQVDKIDALLIQLLSAETGARGYLVTGDAEYLKPYRESIIRMSALLNDFENNPHKPQVRIEDYDRLKALVDSELEALSAAIDARQANRAPPEALLERGKKMMNALRDTIEQLRSQLSSDSASYYVTSLGFLGEGRWIVASLFTAAFVLLLFMYLLIQKQALLRRRIASMMSSENERLEKLIEKRTAELNDLATYLTRVSEAEKRHIAQELHDEMGALLTAARMDTTWITRDLDPELKEKYAGRLARLSQSLDAAISLKRKITTNLKPPLLQELGLTESVRAMAEDLSTDDAYKVNISLPDELPDMDAEKALAIFRIIQESLTNIRKYANAGEIGVGIRIDEDRVRLVVSDDGQGFDVTTTARGGHGVSGMRHRAQMFGGRLEIKSAPGQGTQVRAYIPL